jgi:hypothetical protein
MKLYHGTPEIIESLDSNGVLDFCLTGNKSAAASYGDNVHEFRLDYDAKIASEFDVREMFEADEFYAGLPTFDILDCKHARAALVAAGFDGAEFNDSYESGEMTTVRVFRAELLTLLEITTEG